MDSRGRTTYELEQPVVSDGAAIWRVATQAGTLDVNPPYAYLLWCRDFADNTVIARADDTAIIGFTTGYVRPQAADTFMIWQQAILAEHRGHGLGTRMVAELVNRHRGHGIRYIEATVGPTNSAPARILSQLGQRHNSEVTSQVLFDQGAFPSTDHDEEILIRVGPLRLHEPGRTVESDVRA